MKTGEPFLCRERVIVFGSLPKEAATLDSVSCQDSFRASASEGFRASAARDPKTRGGGVVSPLATTMLLQSQFVVFFNVVKIETG